ncbi:MAG: TonB-dependent receptor, partial [Bacteroidota bacterium]
MKHEVISIKNKALKLNLNPLIYGTIAEIGGGQEVARAFFQAGGASGTVAKTISAYDKTFSDYFYNNNKSGKYVSDNRLSKMLGKEYDDLVKILSGHRDKRTQFFVFADTVETLNFQKTNMGQGWMGVKFQLKPGGEPNEVIIHVNLLEKDSLLQQYTLGTLGVNLIYACFHYHNKPNTFLQSLMDNLDRDRVEINMAQMRGPELDYVDNRLLSVQLVKNEMTNATMFDRYGNVHQPADMLYKKNVLAFRGSFRPITYVGFDMLKSSHGVFKKEIPDYSKETTISICEMTMNNLLDEGDLDE